MINHIIEGKNVIMFDKHVSNDDWDIYTSKGVNIATKMDFIRNSLVLP